MDIEDIPASYKEDAYDMIRSIYKFIPVYNQIKGTYIGMQFMLNMMGLCSTITELWSDRSDINNFSKEVNFYREDEIYAVRRFINDTGKAQVKDYYLTSRFDVDFTSKTVSFSQFNGMADTIIETILEIKPVTRCLRKLYYILLINTNMHFNYLFENPDCGKLSYVPEGSNTDVDIYGLQLRTFDYLWCITDAVLSYKTKYNSELNQIENIFLPYTALGAKYREIDRFTQPNTYYNLFDLDKKMKKSHMTEMEFVLYIRKKDDSSNIIKTDPIKMKIGTEIQVIPETNGINIVFLPAAGSIKNIIYSTFPDAAFEDLDIYFATHFVIVLGTNYLFQSVGKYDWDIPYIEGEIMTLISENSTDADNMIHFISQDGKTFLVPENYEESAI